MSAHRGTAVDVVVPHHDDEENLRRVLAALDAQEDLPGPLHVVVADDGSPDPPVVPDGVTLARQARAGFRASAARHLGAAAGDGDVLLFLDGDTVPEPGYVAAMARAVGGADGDVVAVGRRRHAHLGPAGTPPPAGASPLPDPRWPGEYYAATGGLADGSEGTWRGVISAVLGLSRRLYDLAGGFDPGFVGYGGEDWDLAWRCVQAGGRPRYVPDAVAWHDGPAWEHRVTAAPGHERWAEKNRESLRLAPLLASPLVRPAGTVFAVPAVGVDLHAGTGWEADDVVATCTALLRWGDVAVRLHGPGELCAPCLELTRGDPRVRPAGKAGSGDGRRGWWVPVDEAGPARGPETLVVVDRPCAPGPGSLAELRAALGPSGEAELLASCDGTEPVRVGGAVSTHRAARTAFWGASAPEARGPGAPRVTVPALRRPVRLEREFGGW